MHKKRFVFLNNYCLNRDKKKDHPSDIYSNIFRLRSPWKNHLSEKMATAESKIKNPTECEIDLFVKEDDDASVRRKQSKKLQSEWLQSQSIISSEIND